MTAVPTLPFVVLKAHKPCSTNDIIAASDAAAALTSPPLPTMLIAGRPSGSSSSLNLRQPLYSASTEGASPLGTAPQGTGTSPKSSGMSRATSLNHIPPFTNPNNTLNNANTETTTASPSAAAIIAVGSRPISSTIQTRTIHPQVHYIFENDPLEAEILNAIPKSRCITLDLDPKSGTIKNVESFLTNLQVMDVQLVPFQAALTTSSSSASLNSLGTGTGVGTGFISNTVGNNSNVIGGSNTAVQVNEGGSFPTGSGPFPAAAAVLGRTTSSGASSLQSSATISTTRMTRRPSERSLMNQAGATDSDSQSIKSVKSEEKMPMTSSTAAKDWTLVIEAVEVDEKEQESDSEFLEQSMISSLDTDMMPEDYLTHCDALLKSFSTRSRLVQKVIDYSTMNSSSSSSSPGRESPH